jgi:hypothetical protein
MIFVGGRDGIFDFQVIQFSGTYKDGLAVVIMVTAALSIALVAPKRISGFVHSIPGYTDHVNAAMSVAGEAQDGALQTHSIRSKKSPRKRFCEQPGQEKLSN